ncbi:LysR family transcriptional regulator [Piscinibacter gummiphilus]|uniref:LysR family transcriptional regulator n=1 Tax=Piscinibacter gummiphilus TaxID=946333 RepID=A0A1W6LIB2_9BURK|nr:LysR family transcriptional regulator [Piscinibacter gummiphilus]ARN23995.1 LysR family transcriptional regulator [Piscinibacter gummiphilus]ATU68678.1 LysR family transcriptional regulator [Piscinibacter gummiphilus]
MESLDRQLRYFLCIAELGSLSKAAEDLEQTQSGISKQLSSLEAQLGQSLFSRTGRGVQLTEVGQRLYESLRPAYREIDRALDSARQHNPSQGSIKLATVHTLSYYFTADVVATFVSRLPAANLSLLGRSSPDVVALVEGGKADVGFVYDSAVDSGEVTSIPLFDDVMCLIVGRAASRHEPVDLTGGTPRLIGFPPHYALRRMIHSAGIHPTCVAEAETIDAMLKLVSMDVGNCILPCRIPDKLLLEYNLKKVPIAAPPLRRRVVAIHHRDRPASPLLKQFLECAREIAGKMGPDCGE